MNHIVRDRFCVSVGFEKEIWRVPRPGHAEKLLKDVIVAGIYIEAVPGTRPFSPKSFL